MGNNKLIIGDGILEEYWGGYTEVYEPQTQQLTRYYKPEDNISILDRNGKYIIRNIKSYKIIPNTCFALITRTMDGRNKEEYCIIDNEGFQGLNYTYSMELVIYLTPPKSEDGKPEEWYLLKYVNPKTNEKFLYGVFEDDIVRLKVGDTYLNDAYPVEDSKYNIFAHLDNKEDQLCILTEEYKPYKDYVMDDLFVGMSGFGDNFIRLVLHDVYINKNRDETSILYDTKTGKFPISEPSILKYGIDGQEKYLFAKSESGYRVFVDFPNGMMTELDVRYNGEPCIGIYKENDCFAFFVVKSKSGKIGFLTYNQVIWMDDYRISGEIDYELGPQKDNNKNNILYYKNGDEWRMLKIPRNTNFFFSDIYKIYDGPFDAVYYIGCPVNVIKKGNKETFIYDKGIAIYDKDGNPKWFDKCLPVEENRTSNDYGKMYAIVNGKKINAVTDQEV